MTAKAPFLIYKHPVEGEITMSVDRSTVRFSCMWPFDRLTDEWIEIYNEFALDEYEAAIAALDQTGKALVKGRVSGHIAFRVLSDNRVRFHVVGYERERPPQLFQTLDLSIEDLIPF